MPIVSKRGRELAEEKSEQLAEDKEFGDYGMPLPTNDDEEHEYFYDVGNIPLRQVEITSVADCIDYFGIPYFAMGVEALQFVSRATLMRAVGLDEASLIDGSEDTRL